MFWQVNYQGDFEIAIKRFKKLSEKYFGIETIVAAIFYTLLGGNIKIGGVLIRISHLVVIYIILKYLYKLEGRLSIGFALAMLGLTGIFLVANDVARANWAAQTAFVFMVLGVFWQIVELASERRLLEGALNNKGDLNTQAVDYKTSENRPRYLRQKNYVSFWRINRDLAVAILIMLFLVITNVSYMKSKSDIEKKSEVAQAVSAEQKSNAVSVQPQVFQLEQVKKEKDSKQKKIDSDKKSASDVKVQVLNGNGFEGEANAIAGILKQGKISNIEIGNSSRKDYAQTLVQYRPDNKDIADKITKLISSNYPAKVVANLPRDSVHNVIVILGQDKRDFINNFATTVINANGRKGAAAEIAALLNGAGFSGITVSDTAERISQTQIKFNPTDQFVANIISRTISGKYKSVLLPDSTWARNKITIILGT